MQTRITMTLKPTVVDNVTQVKVEHVLYSNYPKLQATHVLVPLDNGHWTHMCYLIRVTCNY